ncbi:MAG: AtpZ/AtpI family protein [Acidobacteriota bacterium]|nr:AtpZ/AtpI family protein [Acidobacteriota bacterium]
MSKQDQKKVDPGTMKAIGVAWTLPFELVVPTIVGGGIGYLIDRWAHTGPLLLLIIGFLGFGVGLRNMLKVANSLDAKNAK